MSMASLPMSRTIWNASDDDHTLLWLSRCPDSPAVDQPVTACDSLLEPQAEPGRVMGMDGIIGLRRLRQLANLKPPGDGKREGRLPQQPTAQLDRLVLFVPDPLERLVPKSFGKSPTARLAARSLVQMSIAMRSTRVSSSSLAGLNRSIINCCKAQLIGVFARQQPRSSGQAMRRRRCGWI